MFDHNFTDRIGRKGGCLGWSHGVQKVGSPNLSAPTIVLVTIDSRNRQ
jgi:hypothetical protein